MAVGDEMVIGYSVIIYSGVGYIGGMCIYIYVYICGCVCMYVVCI